MKLRSGLNQMRLNLRPGESARIRYVLRCPLRGHYSIGPVSLRSRNTFNLGVEEMYVDHHSDIVIFPQIKEVEEAFLRSRTPKMYTGATTLRTPGQGSEFYSLREYVPGDPFKNINWKAYARTGELMVNEKCRDAVTDLYISPRQSRHCTYWNGAQKPTWKWVLSPQRVLLPSSSNVGILWLWPSM